MKKIKYIDYYILIPYCLLSFFGVIMVYSASSDFNNNPTGLMIKQLFFVLLGLCLAGITFLFKYTLLKNKKLIISALLIIAALLIFVKVQNEQVNGAAAWLNIANFGIQPAEFFKIILIVYLSYMLSRRQNWINENFVKAILQPGLIVIFMIGLVLFQPDAGGAIILFVIALSVIFASGIKPIYGVSFGSIMLVLGVTFTIYVKNNTTFLPAYMYKRFLAFFDPFKVEAGAGKQLVNSYIALANGGLFGKGLGNSVQKKGYLPEPYTDFIMSVVGEELGAITLCLVLIGILIIVARTYIIGIRTKDPFGSMLCIGIATMILVQASINLGGMSGVLPITGVTFPFISYGGSSMLTLAISMGLVLNVSATERMVKMEDLTVNHSNRQLSENSRMSRRNKPY